MDDSRKYWVGFNLVKGIGAVRFGALLDAFGDAESAWKASEADLVELGLGAKVIETFVQVRRQINLDKIWEGIERQGIRVLTWMEAEYPRRLLEIDQPPPVLYLRGELSPEDHWAVAMVGTRRMTPYGRQATEEIARYLGSHGVTVVSGMARGVDGVAHQAALQANGRTLAVLGSGVDKIYPPEHRGLAEKIIQRGALVSDFPPGTEPDSQNFPPRNRIISGLSRAVVVIEAGDTSGALITARFAADQGRDVLALPGSIYGPQSRGTNRLIRDGAQILLHPEEILQLLEMTQVVEQREARVLLPENPVEARLLSALSSEPVHIDEIQAKTALPVEQVSATLVMMELKGLVRQVGGMNYVAVRELPENYRIDGAE